MKTAASDHSTSRYCHSCQDYVEKISWLNSFLTAQPLHYVTSKKYEGTNMTRIMTDSIFAKMHAFLVACWITISKIVLLVNLLIS